MSDGKSYQHYDAGKCAHEGRFRRTIRRLGDRLRGFGGGR